MGVRRCIAFGCKSGRKMKNGKSENVHFFMVPKAEVEMWQHALLRTDIVIKPGHPVCQKHFPVKDILWRKELRGPDGTILGVSADYKVPKLRKGALPSLFLGIASAKTGVISELSEPKVEEFTSNDKVIDTCENTDNTKNINRVDQIDNIYIIIDNNETVNNLHSGIANEKLILNNNPQQKEIKIEPVEESELKVEIKPLFEIIFLNEKSVALPFCWCRQNMRYDGQRIVQFCQFLPKMENGVIQPACTKQVLVDENLEINVLILCQQIEKDKADMRKEPLKCIEDLEMLLKIVNSWKLCPGISSSNDEVKVSTIRQDKEGVWRSVQCSLFLPGTARNGSCEKCRDSKRVIARKILRMKECNQLKRLYVSLTEPQQRKLNEMRKEIRSLRKGRDRALSRIKILKDEKLNYMKRCNASQKTLEQLMLDSNLSGNQRIVLMEIMSASKQTDSRARRYSKVWFSFCLSLHKRSPVIYRFLRANNILPLPAPKTVSRFAQQNLPVVDDGKMSSLEETIEDVVVGHVDFEDELPNVGMETEDS